MNDAVLAEPQGTVWPLEARRRSKAMHKLVVEHIASEIDKVGKCVYAHCADELQYERKRDEHHFRHVTVRTTRGRIFRKEQDQPGIGSTYTVPDAPLDDTFVTVFGDGRVVLSNRPPDDHMVVGNPMRPLKFVEGYREHEQIAALSAVLAYLGEHM
jgi:hypothetical protein